MSFKKLSIEFTLAWRNVWKNKRRTVLTLLTIMVGCAMVIFMKAMIRGAFGQMIEDAASVNNGHIQIHEKGYWDNMGIDYAFKPSAAMIAKLTSDASMQAYTRRVIAAGLISSENDTESAIIQGVDPVQEQKVTSLQKYMLRGGRYLKPDDRENIIMGETLAKNLGVKVGDSLSLLSQGFDGSVAAANLTLVGMFRSGNPEYDGYLIVMSIEQAKDTFTMMDYITSIVIRLRDGTQMEAVRSDLRRSVGSKDIEIMGWDDLMPDMVQLINMKQIQNYIFEFILFMIVAFGVMNTIQMSVYERIREFGIMLAIGTRPEQIRRMVQIESFYIAVLGVILGIALGVALCVYFSIHPIDYSRFSGQIGNTFGVSVNTMPAKLELSNILSTSIILLIVAVLFTIAPARRASMLKPIEAIRKL
jgi:putative ABC transport system permease protein